MKNIILAFTSIFLLASFAQAETFQVQGRLLDDVNLNGRINKMIFTEQKQEIALINEYLESDSCKNGSFEVREVATGLFELVEIVDCEEFIDETENVQNCPELFKPVCGELVDRNCAGFMCGKSLPKIHTFSNTCELYKSKSVYIHEGSCK